MQSSDRVADRRSRLFAKNGGPGGTEFRTIGHHWFYQ